MQLIPYLNTRAGGILTHEDWRSAGISKGLLQLDRLLMKPGIEALQRLSNLKQFNPWHGELGLDMTLMSADAKGLFTLVSTLDGSKIRLDSVRMAALLNHLKPDFLVLTSKQAQEFGGLLDENIACITDTNEDYLVTDQIAEDGAKGIVYATENRYQITEGQFRMDTGVLDKHCTCPACSQRLSKAYFHHLYAQVPFLCQRFLIVHNLYEFCKPHDFKQKIKLTKISKTD